MPPEESSSQPTVKKTISIHLTPGLEVQPEHLAAVGPHVPAVAPGVGSIEVWTTFATVEADQSIRGRLIKKRVGRDEARRLLELGRELGGRWIKGQALKEDVARLEDVACAPNADVLATAEAIAEIPARARAVLFHRCEQALAEAGGTADLAKAQTLIQHIENSDLKAPDFVLFTLVWLLSLSPERPNDDSVLHWVLRHEEDRVGLTGIISQLDDLFGDVTGRRTSSTIQSRLDRAGALRFRVSMPVLGPQVVVPDANLTSPPPAVDPVATRAVTRPATAVDTQRPAITSPPAQTHPTPVRVPQESAPVTSSQATTPPPPVRQAQETPSPTPTVPPAVVTELKRTIEHLRRDMDILRKDLDNTNERVDYALKKLQNFGQAPYAADEPPVSLDEFATTSPTRRLLSDRLLLWIAITLLISAVLVMIVRFLWNSEAHPPENPPSVSSAIPQETLQQPTAQLPDPTEGVGKPTPAPTTPEPVPEPPPTPTDDPEPELVMPGEEPTEEPEPAPPTEPVAVEPAPTEIPVVANEVTAEEYGVGTEATHRLTRSSKIFSFTQKLPLRVEDLQGSDALIGECIVTLADRSDYAKRIYPGYEPIRLSCAGSTKKVCETLGCEPQNSCVTAASMIKPCN